MTEATKRVLNRIRQLLDKETKTSIETRWEVGRLVQEAQDAPDQYGSKVVEKFAKALGCHADTLYVAATVYQAWPTKQELETLLNLRDECHDRPITWSHLDVVASRACESEREALLEYWQANGSSVRQLKQHVQQLQAEHEPDEQAQTNEMPKRLQRAMEQLDQFGTTSSELVYGHSSISSTLDDAVKACHGEADTLRMRDRLELTITEAEKLQANLGELVERCRQSLAQLDSQLSERSVNSEDKEAA